MTTAVTKLRRGFRTDPAPVVVAVGLCVVAGFLLTQTGSRIGLLVIPIALGAVVVVAFEAPIVLFGFLALILGLVSGDAVDGPFPSLIDPLYGTLYVYYVVILLLVSLGLDRSWGGRRWPGAPAAVALLLVLIAIGSAVRFGAFDADMFVARPIILLFLSIVTGYWLAGRYGADVILKILVCSGGLAAILGLYNIATGHTLSFYDSSFVYLLGVTATLVLFSAVEIGFARFPFLIAAAIVIVFSLRRGTIIAVAITVLLTGIVKGRGGFRTVAALVAVIVVLAEIVMPGLVFNNVARLVSYFSGGTGTDFSVNYRKYETANAWLNVKQHWLGGIGPTTEWSLFRVFGGKFQPYDQLYLHNSYLWMWLRFSLVGLIAYVAFFVVSAGVLIRKSAPIVSVIVGSSIVGLAFAVATASFVTTTVRWPLFVGLMVGIGLHCRNAASAAPTTS